MGRRVPKHYDTREQALQAGDELRQHLAVTYPDHAPLKTKVPESPDQKTGKYVLFLILDPTKYYPPQITQRTEHNGYTLTTVRRK